MLQNDRFCALWGLTCAPEGFRAQASNMTRHRAIPRASRCLDGARSDETHLSTFQPRAQAAPRFPRAHGHKGRSQDHQRTPRKRPCQAERVSALASLSVMEPPVAPGHGPPAVSLCVLTKRADFVRASHGRRFGTPGFNLQARKRAADEAAGVRIGFTCSKKVGNAVARNRAKRRLREIARSVLPELGRDGWDYVLVGRKETTATLPYDQLQADLARALKKVHG